MSSYFEDFTNEEYAKYSELFNYNTELEDGDNIYYTDPVWWTKLNDLDQLVEDVKNSICSSGEYVRVLP